MWATTGGLRDRSTDWDVCKWPVTFAWSKHGATVSGDENNNKNQVQYFHVPMLNSSTCIFFFLFCLFITVGQWRPLKPGVLMTAAGSLCCLGFLALCRGFPHHICPFFFSFFFFPLLTQRWPDNSCTHTDAVNWDTDKSRQLCFHTSALTTAHHVTHRQFFCFIFFGLNEQKYTSI